MKLYIFNDKLKFYCIQTNVQFICGTVNCQECTVHNSEIWKYSVSDDHACKSLNVIGRLSDVTLLPVATNTMYTYNIVMMNNSLHGMDSKSTRTLAATIIMCA